MALFGKRKAVYPKMPAGSFKPVLKCSICTGEQIMCAQDAVTGEMHELMFVRSQSDLEGFCADNGILIGDIEKVW